MIDPVTRETIERLKKISIFKDVADDDNAMARIAPLFSTRFLAGGTTIIAEGEFGNELYILKSGSVEIIKRTLKENEPYTVTELNAQMNIFFGEMAILDSDKRSATVVCKSDCELYVLTREQFMELGDNHPAIGLSVTRELSRSLCHRLRKANQDVVILFDALLQEVVESGGLG